MCTSLFLLLLDKSIRSIVKNNSQSFCVVARYDFIELSSQSAMATLRGNFKLVPTCCKLHKSVHNTPCCCYYCY